MAAMPRLDPFSSWQRTCMHLLHCILLPFDSELSRGFVTLQRCWAEALGHPRSSKQLIFHHLGRWCLLWLHCLNLQAVFTGCCFTSCATSRRSSATKGACWLNDWSLNHWSFRAPKSKVRFTLGSSSWAKGLAASNHVERIHVLHRFLVCGIEVKRFRSMEAIRDLGNARTSAIQRLAEWCCGKGPRNCNKTGQITDRFPDFE